MPRVAIAIGSGYGWRVSAVLQVGHFVASTRVEGPHLRAALWLQGCSLRCPGCCNPELLASTGGEAMTVEALGERVHASARAHAIEGLTILGGEPLEQLPGLIELCERVQALGLGVIVFTGHTLAHAQTLPGFARLWAAIDTLVDGPFMAREPEPEPEPPPAVGGRRFIGSRNPTLQHRTPRYADPSLWQGRNGAELRIAPDGRVSVLGFPGEARRLLGLIRTNHG